MNKRLPSPPHPSGDLLEDYGMLASTRHDCNEGAFVIATAIRLMRLVAMANVQNLFTIFQNSINKASDHEVTLNGSKTTQNSHLHLLCFYFHDKMLK